MNKKIDKTYKDSYKQLDHIILNYDKHGEDFGNQKRNSLKLFDLDGEVIIVKSFKTPNLFNQVIYQFFRKSKAQRSFEYAHKLLDLGIGTPKPIAYYEFPKNLFFNKSYYVSQHLNCDYTFRDLTEDFDIPDRENILRAFTRFTYNLHEKKVMFLDHSPGNTLIRKEKDHYKFYLVDLNRMRFKTLNYQERIENFSRLTIDKNIVEIMSDEYAKCIHKDPSEVFDLMWYKAVSFRKKYQRKKVLKNKFNVK